MSEANALSQITENMRTAVGQDCGLGKTLKFSIDGAGPVYVDATKVPNEVSNADGPADCVISVSLDNFQKLAEGSGSATTMFMMGKLKVSGDIGIAMKAEKLLKQP